MRARIVAACLVVVAVAGCSLLTNLDGLATPDSGANDAQVDATLDADRDASADADATTDASRCPVVDGGVVFCDDFDDSDASVFIHWSKQVMLGDAMVSRAASDASPPFCVELVMPSNDGGARAEVARKFLIAPTKHVTYSFDLRVAQYPTSGGQVDVSSLELAGDTLLGARDYLELRANSAAFDEQLPIDGGASFQTISHLLTTAIAQGVWVSVRLEWDIGDGGITLAAFFDGSPVVVPTLLDPRSLFTTPYLFAGIAYETPNSGGVTIDIDNVVFTYE